MGVRSRLFASATFPLLSLSLAWQPVHAAALTQTGVTVSRALPAGSFDVAQQSPDEGQPDDQDPRKRKKHGEQGQEGQPQQEEQKHEPAGAEQPRAKAPQQEEQGGAAPAQAQPGGEAEQPKHRKQQQEQQEAQPAPAQPEAQPEAPKHKQQTQQEAEPAPAAPAQQQAEPEAQPTPKKHKQNAEQAQPEPEQPAETPKQSAKPAAPQAEQPATQQMQAEPQQDGQQPHKKHQKPQDQSGEPSKQPAEQAAPAQPEAPAAQKAPAAKAGTEQPAPTKQEQQQPAEAAPAPAKPAVTKNGAEQPAKPEAQPADQGTTQPNGMKAAPQQPAANAPAAPAAPQGGNAEGGQQAEGAVPPSAPVSPQELERRKKIAENPAQATGPVILPVQNGAAVLDSDKDAARRGHWQGGQGGQGQAPGQPRQPGANGQMQGSQQPVAPANVRAPTSDADAQRAAGGGQQRAPVQIEAVTSERGQRMNARPDFARPDGAQVEDRQDNRVILNIDNNVFVRHDDTQRFVRDGERPTYEQLPRDRFRETIDRPDGDRIVTIRNRYGDIVQRSRIDARGREYVLFYSPELEEQPDNDDYFRDPGENLPPMRLRIPLNQYIIDTSSDQDQNYYNFLREPPVEPVERVYSLNEVRYSARIRDKVRRIDLDTITFATASADIPMAQAKTLRGIADAIGQIIKKDPTETFLIEGHTDAVGSAQSNLILSDQRAESVANVLSDVYGIPPENLATQGYGEQYLKVNTQGPEQENRRVTIRRVTALVRPVASRQ